MALTKSVDESARGDDKSELNWGKPLFFATLIAILVFFWWLLIYSGGVRGPHG